MIVCVCNALSSSSCADTAGSGRCRSVGCMYRLQGARVRCGKCLPAMRGILSQHGPGEPAAAEPSRGSAAPSGCGSATP
jgi:bacterioferritin-associated ferredoxin